MAKGNNNVRNKKPHSSKPYDVSNSFVKKVTSGVSSLLPQTSWLSRWFASTSTNVENTPSTSSVSNDGEDHDDEHVGHSPPAKRARIPLNRPFPANSFRVSSPLDRGETHPWPSESVTSPIPNVFADSAVAGPSGLSRSPVSTAPFQTSNTPGEGLEGKINGDGGSDSSESTSGCSSLAPQRATTSGTTLTHRASDNKTSNHMSSYSLFPSATHNLSPSINSSLSRRRPSFNVSSFGSPNLDSSKLSRESSLNSPFYIGRTMYGGASAYRRPREGAASEQSFLSSTRRGGVAVRPVNEKTQPGASAEASMSQTARRILEALEQFSSPVSEARRMPLPSQPALCAKRKRPLESLSTSPAKSSLASAAATNPLTIPMPPERLRLHRLQDATEAARRIASSVSSSKSKYAFRSNDDGQRGGIGKVTKSKPLDADEQPLPVNLPLVSLPITTLPSFDLFNIPVQTTSADSRTNNYKLTSSGEKNSDKVEVEKKITCADSSSRASNTGCVDSSAAASSGTKSINFMHGKVSSNVPNFKIGADNKCVRNNEILSANMFNNPEKSNAKSVSFSGTDLYNINNPVNPKGKIEVSNNEHSTGTYKPSAVSSFAVKGAPFSTVRAGSDSSLVTNDFFFSTPAVISSSKHKETTESKMKNFDFCMPEVLDGSNFSNKVKRNEPNGFRQLHSNSKIDDVQESIVLNANSKEGTGKLNTSRGNECKVISPFAVKAGAPAEKQNNGWGTKFSSPDTWECSSCMVRNKNNVKVCVCCGNNQPVTFTSDSKDVNDKKDSLVQTKSTSFTSSGWGNHFAPQPGTWECSVCLVRNKASDANCVACTSPRSNADKPGPAASMTMTKTITTGDWGFQFKLTASQWECSACLVRNDEKNKKCISCTTPRNIDSSNSKSDSSAIVNAKVSSGWGTKFKKPSSSWECPVCMIQNKNSEVKCAACQEPKPGMDTNCSSTGGSIKFNFEIPSGASNFKFGIDKADLKQTETTSATSKFEGSNKTETSEARSQTGFTFGVSSGDTKIPSGINFGVSPIDSTSSSDKLESKVETNVTSTSVPNVPSLAPGLNTQASQKSLLQPETSKATGFTFGVLAKSSTASVNESIGETTTIANAGDGGSTKNDLNFPVTQANPAISNADDSEKKVTIFSSPVQKGEQKSTNEVKSGFSFGTSSTPTVISTLSSAITSTTTSVAMVKTPGFNFPSNESSVKSTNIVTTSTTSAVATPITSSGLFSFGNNSAPFKPSSTSASTFSFGGTGAPTTSSGVFGSTQPGQFKSSGEGLFANNPATSTVPVFGSSSAITLKPTFGSNTATSTAVSSATTSSSTSAFGSSASVFASPSTTTTTTTVAFGSGITKPTFANVTSGFGSVTTAVVASVTTSVTTTSSNSNPASSFAMPTTTASFGPPTTSTFGSGAPTFGSSAAPSGFGLATTTASISTTTSAPNFGTPNPVAFGAAASTGNCFGATNITQSFNTTTSNVFGSTNLPSFGSALTTSAFGATAASSSFGSGFGTATTTAPTFGSHVPPATTTSTTSSLPSFGTFSNAGKPAQGLFLFGSNPTSTTHSSNFSFNVTSQASGGQTVPSGTAAFSFGSGAAPSASNVTTSTNTAPTVTAPTAVAPAPASAFGGFSFTGGSSGTAPSTSSLFGSAPAAAAAAAPAPAPAPTPTLAPSLAPAPVFGAPSMPSSTPAAPAFGSGSATSSSVFRPTFNFAPGGSQPFSFGSGAQAGTAQAPGNSGFSFGQSQPPVQSQPQPSQFNPNVRPIYNFTGGDTPQFTASGQSSPGPQRRIVKKAMRRRT